MFIVMSCRYICASVKAFQPIQLLHGCSPCKRVLVQISPNNTVIIVLLGQNLVLDQAIKVAHAIAVPMVLRKG